MKASFHVAGGSLLARGLAGLPERVSKTVQRQALRAAAEPMRDAMAKLAPQEPGKPDLRDSMTISNARGGEHIFDEEVAVAVGPSRAGFYGIFQEFGTIHHGAQPFARPAFDQNVRKALDILSKFLWAALAKRRGSVTGIQSGPGRTL